ncbi:hypothetical protein [Acutalibacter sp. 1XD8-36]
MKIVKDCDGKKAPGAAFQRACGGCEQAGGAARILVPESPYPKARLS